MSKNKPKETIEYVIRLQDKERQILDEFLTSQQVLNYAEAFDKFTSFENLYLLVTVIEIVTGKELLPGTPNDIYKIIDALRNTNWKSIGQDGEYSLSGINNIGVVVNKILDGLT